MAHGRAGIDGVSFAAIEERKRGTALLTIVRVLAGGDDQMDMVGDQAIRINPPAKPIFPFLECIKIKRVIVITGKNNLTIMDSLKDMVEEDGTPGIPSRGATTIVGRSGGRSFSNHISMLCRDLTWR